MKILITGHRGFIGQNLFNQLAQNHTVDGWEWGDSLFPDVIGYDCVVHLGAISATTERDVDKILNQNYEFSYKLLMHCSTHGVDFHYASSASVYGDSEPDTDSGFSELCSPAPMNPYAWSKYLFDRLVMKSIPSMKNIKVYGFRYFNVFGPHEEHKGAQASLWSKWNANPGPHDLFQESDDVYRDFVHVSDVCNIHEMFLDKQPESGIYNIGSGKATSIGLTARKYKGVEFNVISMPEELKGQYQFFTQANNKKLLDVIGDYTFKEFKQ
jgi:ADP-L-glycero-D-manno-heptose 6-epimerase